jgi:hypothetical protein
MNDGDSLSSIGEGRGQSEMTTERGSKSTNRYEKHRCYEEYIYKLIDFL